MRFIAITRAYRKKIIIHHESIEEVIDWAKANNLAYKEMEEEIKMGMPRFTVKREDHGELMEEAIKALKECRWQASELAPHEYERIGADHTEIVQIMKATTNKTL